MRVYKILVTIEANELCERAGFLSAEYFYRRNPLNNEETKDEVYHSLSKAVDDVHEIVRSLNYLREQMQTLISPLINFEVDVAIIATTTEWITIYESKSKFNANWEVLRSVVESGEIDSMQKKHGNVLFE